MKILLGFSGGMDSTACLVYCLNKFPKEHIFIHHIDVSKRQNKGIAENYCCKRSLVMLEKKFGKLNYSESYINSDIINIQLEIKSAIIASLAKSIKATHICDGRKLIYSNTEDRNKTNDRQSNIYNIIYPEHIGLYPLKDKTKPEVFDLLPEWAKTNFWSCIFPILDNNKFIPCNKCSSCNEYKNEGIVHPVLETTNYLDNTKSAWENNNENSS